MSSSDSMLLVIVLYFIGLGLGYVMGSGTDHKPTIEQRLERLEAGRK